jgi:predicted ATPase
MSADRFRPAAGAVNDDGQYAPDHYWWLRYEWRNLLPACLICANHKGSKFPVVGERSAIGASWEDIQHEHALLIDPTVDEPSEHLVPDIETGVLGPRTQRGMATIQILSLNHEDLVMQRLQQVQHAKYFVAEYLSSFSDASADPADIRTTFGSIIDGNVPFTMFGRAALFELRERFAEQGITIPLPDPRAERIDDHGVSDLATLYVEAVSIRNFRGIDALDVSLSDVAALEHAIDEQRDVPTRWAMLIGENGAGKSTFLQAVALVLMRFSGLRYPLKAGEVLRHGESHGSVELQLSGMSKPLRVEFSRASDRFRRNGPDIGRILLVGYGATRLPPRRRRTAAAKRSRRMPVAADTAARSPVRVSNLFDPYVALRDADEWFMSLAERSDVFDYAALALKDVLGMHSEVNLRPGGSLRDRRDCVLVVDGAETLTFSDLSDGYRSMIALTTDMMMTLQQYGGRAFDTVEGIILLDEIGAHLHPRWKMRVVECLRRAFKRVQLIGSTHDPLCLRGLVNGEVFVLRKTGNHVFAVADLPPVEGLRVDQLLTSEFFGLHSTLDPALESDFERYYALLAARRLSPEEGAEVERLATKLEPLSLPGMSRRERLVLRYIDEFLARTEREPDAGVVEELSEQARREIRQALADALAEDEA